MENLTCGRMLADVDSNADYYGIIRSAPAANGIYDKRRYDVVCCSEDSLWIMDLSQPDKWILPILAGIATFIAFSMNQQQQEEATGTAAQMNGMMKMMKYIFPIMIVWMGRSFPSVWLLYWALGQIMQIFFNIHLKSVRNKLKRGIKRRKNSKFLFDNAGGIKYGFFRKVGYRRRRNCQTWLLIDLNWKEMK